MDTTNNESGGGETCHEEAVAHNAQVYPVGDAAEAVLSKGRQ